MTTVLKLGGELLEDAAALQTAASAIVHLATNGALVVVHGGGASATTSACRSPATAACAWSR